MSHPSVFELQAPLRAKYKVEPQAAMVTDHAHAKGASAADPFHSTVQPMPGCGVALPVGVHRALGGPHDAPTPGDILCAALAACQDSAVRMVANRLGVELEFLEVEVHGEVDVRGTLLIGKNVPVGFQSMRCDVRLRAKEGTKPELLEKLRIGQRWVGPGQLFNIASKWPPKSCFLGPWNNIFDPKNALLRRWKCQGLRYFLCVYLNHILRG